MIRGTPMTSKTFIWGYDYKYMVHYDYGILWWYIYIAQMIYHIPKYMVYYGIFMVYVCIYIYMNDYIWLDMIIYDIWWYTYHHIPNDLPIIQNRRGTSQSSLQHRTRETCAEMLRQLHIAALRSGTDQLIACLTFPGKKKGLTGI